MDKGTDRLSIVLMAGMLVGIIYCLSRLASTVPSPTESLLWSVILTIFSVIGSWIASHYYSQASFNTSQRTFASKAAEKVLNLSNELDRLSVSLQEDLKPEQYATSAEEILAKSLALENAVYALRTLKSMNDGSLSDWAGVTGEDIIDARREDQEEKETRLRDLVDRLAALSSATVQKEAAPHAIEEQEPAQFSSELASLRDDVRALAAQVSGLPVRRQPGPTWTKERVKTACPKCGAALTYRQRTKPGVIRPVNCPSCKAPLYSERVGTEFILKDRVPVPEDVVCPKCKANCAVGLDPVPGTALQVECASCKSPLRIVRRAKDKGLRIQLLKGEAQGAPIPLSDDFLKRVYDSMGAQPWPQGRARSAAQSLGITLGELQTAIQELIERGEFKMQVDGKLYIPDGRA